ncbi:MAG: NAD(P)-dependent oxidoreductase [Chloroflexi bacterium]|nr:NAD(P)-dependent oxidoreductase [Chloroflexota bacterium]
MAILITGGTGFLGSHIARRLLKEGYKDIVCLDLFPNAANLRDAADKVTVVQGDSSEAVELFKTVTKYKVTEIFHMAYLMSRGAEESPAQAIRVNALGVSNVFEVALLCGVRRVMWPSSGAVYGHYMTVWKDADEPLTMQNLPLADSMYGSCKYFNERTAELFAKRGLDYIAFRLPNIYGYGRSLRPGVTPDVYAKIIEIPASGKPFVAPPPEQKFAWTYVEDVAEAFLCALRADKPATRIFNVSGEVRSTFDTVVYIKSILPGAQIEFGKELARRLPICDATPIKEQLGWRPKFTMEQGIQDYLAKMKAAGFKFG